MSNIESDAIEQPRGTNGHKGGQYSEHKPRAPHPSTELTLTGDIGVNPTDILPGDTVWGLGEDDELEELGRALSIGFNSADYDLIRVRLADGRAFTARTSDIVSVHRDAVAPGYDVDADYSDRLAAAHHTLTSAETLRQIVDEESDEAFMLAVVTHPNTPHNIIDRATKLASYAVLSAALANKNAGVYTLEWIRKQAADRQHAFAGLLNERGYNARVLWDMRQNEHLRDDAAHEIAARSTTR